MQLDFKSVKIYRAQTPQNLTLTKIVQVHPCPGPVVCEYTVSATSVVSSTRGSYCRYRSVNCLMRIILSEIHRDFVCLL